MTSFFCRNLNISIWRGLFCALTSDYSSDSSDYGDSSDYCDSSDSGDYCDYRDSSDYGDSSDTSDYCDSSDSDDYCDSTILCIVSRVLFSLILVRATPIASHYRNYSPRHPHKFTYSRLHNTYETV